MEKLTGKKHIVDLTKEEKDQLIDLTNKGQVSARRLKRANILLTAGIGKTDAEIPGTLDTSPSTVWRTRTRFVESTPEFALNERPRCCRPP